MTATFLGLCPRPVACASCGGTFTPARPNHLLCDSCYWWGRAIDHMQAAADALGTADKMRAVCAS